MKRIMIAAPKSGSGKTLITCGLLRLMTRQGYDVTSYKCGPDYIDPMFHRRVLGVPGGNLDSFFSTESEIRSIMSRCGHEFAVIEGVMGIYDGIISGNTGDDNASSLQYNGSCYDIARITETPVILVIDVRGMGQTMVSIIKGILADDEYHLIRGIILNRISGRYYDQISPLIRNALPEYASLIGYIPVSEDINLESRHLGLVMPDEISDIMKRLDSAADLIEANIDTGSLVSIMEQAETINTLSPEQVHETADCSIKHVVPADEVLVLAVARDDAFCFYYEENLRMLKRAGITVKEFSPLKDDTVPDDADGILLGGGYPELYAEQLSSNNSMRDSILNAITGGIPSYAECGGFMYLLDTLTDKNGKVWPMCGVLKGGSHYTGRLSRFGYIDLTLPDGLSVRGHEFHYYDSDNNGTDAHAVKPGSGRAWECIHAGPDHIWGYPHLWYPSCPELIELIRKSMILSKKRS